MKKYCFDTSGISNPLESMPEDIHESMWQRIVPIVESGCIAVTSEIYAEMINIPGSIGQCIKSNKLKMVLEVNQGSWNWVNYVNHSTRMNTTYHNFISEYCGGSPKTVCLNDMTIIALAKCLGIPLVSMEGSTNSSSSKRKIPDICKLEGIEHLYFSDFLRRERIKV